VRSKRLIAIVARVTLKDVDEAGFSKVMEPKAGADIGAQLTKIPLLG
jgi:hypothetical protein